MNLIKLHVLVLIEKYKKVTDVAKELKLKQPTVTFHMKSLEDELGIPLYKSKAGRTLLSDAGKSILPFAQQMTALYKEALHTAALYKEQNGASFQAGGEDLYSAQLLSGIRLLKEEFPEINCGIRLLTEPELADLFSKGEMDAVLLEQHAASQLDGSFEPLFSDEMAVICKTEHPWAQKGEVPIEGLEQEKWVEYEAAGARRLKQLLKERHQINLKAAIEVSTFEAALQAVEIGMGLALATKRAAVNYDADYKKIAVLPLPEALQLKLTVGLLYQEDETKTGFAEKLASSVKQNEEAAQE